LSRLPPPERAFVHAQDSGQLLCPGKTEVRIFDYVDREVPMLQRMFERRLRTYKAIGYARADAPPGYQESVDGPVLEYDEDALRYFDNLLQG
jgi:hypothetical protein